MQSVSWLAFGTSNALSHTVVHFFPSSGTVSAPYPARCKFRLFGQGETGKSVTIEGPRLSHPDGVRLDQVFPTLSDGVQGFLGMEVSLVAVQPRVDLSPSQCMIELSTRAVSTKFVPHRLHSAENGQSRAHVVPKSIIVQDSFAKGSVVLVNGTSNAVDVPLRLGRSATNDGQVRSHRQGQYSVSEIPFSSKEGACTISKPCSWGAAELGQIELEKELPSGVACYSVHRDTSTNLPISVHAL